MADARQRVELYGHLMAARVRAQLQYRLSFALDLIGAFFITFIDFLAILVVFSHLSRLAGWSLAEVAFFYGVANLSFALTDLLIGHLDLLPQMVRTGSFDLMLIRPMSSLFGVLSSDLALRKIGRAAQAVVVLLYALSHIHVPWTPARLAMLLSMIVTGIVIYSSIWISFMTITFWTVEVREIANAFTYGGSFLASYPINIFGGWTRRLLGFVVPLAFVSYFPGLFVLGRHDPLGTPYVLQFCTPLVALALTLIASEAWRFGVGHYQSTGS